MADSGRNPIKRASGMPKDNTDKSKDGQQVDKKGTGASNQDSPSGRTLSHGNSILELRSIFERNTEETSRLEQLVNPNGDCRSEKPSSSKWTEDSRQWKDNPTTGAGQLKGGSQSVHSSSSKGKTTGSGSNLAQSFHGGDTKQNTPKEDITQQTKRPLDATYVVTETGSKKNKNSSPGLKSEIKVEKTSGPEAKDAQGKGDEGTKQAGDTKPGTEDQIPDSAEKKSASTEQQADGGGQQEGTQADSENRDIVVSENENKKRDAVDGTMMEEFITTDRLSPRFVELENKAKTLEERNDTLEKDKIKLLKEMEKLEIEKRQEAEQVKALTDHNAAAQNENLELQKGRKEQAGTIKDLTANINAAEERIKQRDDEILEGCAREGHLHTQLKEQQKRYKDLDKAFKGKERDLQELQGEYKDLKARFGKMAGEKMKHNNPDIINLGDQNRSTKIAERYSTMYNETWTDAWADQTEELKMADEKATENLLQVLKDCFKYCTEQAEAQFDQLSNILNNPVQSLDMAKQVRQEASASKDTSDTTLRELRKEISLRATEQVKNAFWEQMKKEEHCEKWRDGSKAYILQCADVCWAMVLNLPPLYMEFDVQPGTEVNTNFYTKRSSGKVFKQLVWPALFNGKGGGMLAKGVVEATKTISKK